MTENNYWYEVGVHPKPTEADLPIVVGQPGARSTYWKGVPSLHNGERWCRISLPSETAPPPEDEGVEVDGYRYRIGKFGNVIEVAPFGASDWTTLTMLGQSTTTDLLVHHTRIATALGLASAPLPAEERAVVKEAKVIAGMIARGYSEHAIAEVVHRHLLPLVDALRARDEAES